MHITNDELKRRFNYHAPKTQAKAEQHEQVRAVLLAAAEEIVELTGAPTREQSLAITALEEGMFWANAAIAREITGDDALPRPIIPDPGKAQT
jgi:hypothetical protein